METPPTSTGGLLSLLGLMPSRPCRSSAGGGPPRDVLPGASGKRGGENKSVRRWARPVWEAPLQEGLEDPRAVFQAPRGTQVRLQEQWRQSEGVSLWLWL